MFGKKNRPELTGNWEEPGVIGTRVEIAKNRIVILWRSDPVLDTEFTAEETPEGILRLHLKKTGLRYSRASSDYASVTDVYLQEGKLHLCKHFPISGPDEEILQKTENSRFGNYDIVDKEVLPILRGVWEDGDGFWKLVFQGNTMTCRGDKFPIHVLRSRSGYHPEEFRVVHADPARDMVGDFNALEFTAGQLRGVMHVCDGPTMYVVFRHKDP